MSFYGAQINKLNGGLGRFSQSDRTVCLIMGMPDSGVMNYNQAIELFDINTVEDLGITPATDDATDSQAYYHLSEMFRLAPESTFWFIPVLKASTVLDLVNNFALKAALRSINGLNVIGIAGVATPMDRAGDDAMLLQGLVNTFASENLYIDGIFVECVEPEGPLDVEDFPSLRNFSAPNVSCVIGRDDVHAAAVGTALGSVAVRKIHEDIGSVDIEQKPRTRRGQENYSLSDPLLGRWLSASLINGDLILGVRADRLNDLTEKGYMYVGSFANYPGFYWNGCPTAVNESSDYAYFNLNCIWNKAARIIRNTLIPRIRSKVPTDPETGYLKSTWVAGCESMVNAALDRMVAEGNIEAYEVYINPAQAIGVGVPLEIKCQLVVGRIVHEFSVDLGLTNKL